MNKSSALSYTNAVQLNSVMMYQYNQEQSLTETHDVKNLLRNAQRKNFL